MNGVISPRFTPGRILYLLYHLPLGEIRRCVREGGPGEQWLDYRGRKEMELAAAKLPSLNFEGGAELEIHQLTGRRYAFQSMFCVWSLARVAQRNVAPVFYDDGTLTTFQARRLQALFPRARIVTSEETWEKVEQHLPADRFPILRERFSRYPHIRKLVNIHLGSRGWKLALDADLLFFRQPDFLLQWLGNPQRPLYLLDVAEAYGYSPLLLRELAGGALPSCVNSGLCGWLSESIDWAKVERWCGLLLRREGSHYLLEQALTALLLAGQDCSIAPADEYITLPFRDDVQFARGVMHHYVGASKRWYYREAWKKVTEDERIIL